MLRLRRPCGARITTITTTAVRMIAFAAALLVSELKEGQDIPVGIGDLEAPQPLVYERQLLYERRPPLAELGKERIGVRRVDVGIPTRPFMPSVVWTRKHVGTDGLEHDADPVPAHSGIERAAVWTLEVELEAEALAVVSNRGLQILHDEERSNRNEIATRRFAGLAVCIGLG